MGCFDTLSDGETSLQVKCFGGELDVFHVGDRVPDLHHYEGYRRWNDKAQLSTYTIVNDPYEPRYALVKDHIFLGFETDKAKTWKPYVARWGDLMV